MILNRFNYLAESILWKLLFVYFGFIFQYNKPSKSQSVNLIVSYPIVQEGGRLFDSPDTIPILYYGKYVVYKLPYNFTIENDEKIILVEKRYNYFIFSEGNNYGLLYQSLTDTNTAQKLLVDSFLLERGYAVKFDTTGCLLNERIFNSQKSKLLEKYIPKIKGGENSVDSLYYYYSKDLVSIEYSFSPRLDSVTHMKLYKIRLLLNEKYSPKHNITMPKREFLFKFESAIIPDSTEIVNFIEYVANHQNL